MTGSPGDILAIQQLKHRYAYATDAVDRDAFLALFTDDATFDVGFYGVGEGRGDFAAFIDELGELDYETRAHNLTNPLIDIEGDEATGTWYYVVLYETPDGDLLLGQGRYDDEFTRVDGTWRISHLEAERRITKELTF